MRSDGNRALIDEPPVIQVLGTLALGPLSTRFDVRGLGARLLLALVTAPPDGLDDEVLIRRLWPSAPPANAAYSLRNQVATMRKRLGADAILRTSGGYRLHPSMETDVDEFDRRVADGRFAEAFALVRGPTLAEVRHEGWAIVAVTALDERIALAADRWGAERCTAPTEDDLAWLLDQVKVARHREIRWAHVITAYANLGLRAEVLRAAHEARRTLGEVGLTVSPALRTLERSVLLEETGGPSTDVASIVRSTSHDTTGPVSLARVTESPGLFTVRARGGRAATDGVLAEISETARAAGEQVVYLRAGNASRFLATLADRIADLATEGADDPWLGLLHGGDHTAVPLGDPAVTAASVQRALIKLASGIGAIAPLWVIVNDAEALDPAHRRFLDRLATCDDVTVVLTYGQPSDDEPDDDTTPPSTPATEFIREASRLLTAGGPTEAVPLAAAFLDRHALVARDASTITACVMAASILLADPPHAAAGTAALELSERRAKDLGDDAVMADVVLARGPIENLGGPSRRIADRAIGLEAQVDRDDLARRVQLCCWAAHHLLLVGDRTGATALIDRAEGLSAQSDLAVLTSLVLSLRVQSQLDVDGSPTATAAAMARLEAWAALTHCITAEAASGLIGLAVEMGAGTFASTLAAADALSSFVEALPRADIRWAPSAARAAIAMAALDEADPVAAEVAIEEAQRLAAAIGLQGGEASAFLQRMVLSYQREQLAAQLPMLESLAGQPRSAPLFVAAHGLALVTTGDTERATEAADRLATDRLLHGTVWPVVASFAAELAWHTNHAALAERLWRALSPWAGWGLNVAGTLYAGAVDTALGLCAAARGDAATAAALLHAGAKHDRTRGAHWWAHHADGLREGLISR